MFTIGCHLSASKGYLAMAKQATELGGNTFQFFTRNPRGGTAKAIDPADIAAFHAYCANRQFGTILAHAPYTLNACAADERVMDFCLRTMADDLRRMEHTPHQLYNFHPGSHVGQGIEKGIEKERERNDALNSKRVKFLRSQNVPDDVISAMLAIK